MFGHPLSVRQVADVCPVGEDVGWSLSLQWIPSHSGVPGPERGCQRPGVSHAQQLADVFLPGYFLRSFVFLERCTKMNKDRPVLRSLTSIPA